jgi:hypothetical protein
VALFVHDLAPSHPRRRLRYIDKTIAFRIAKDNHHPQRLISSNTSSEFSESGILHHPIKERGICKRAHNLDVRRELAF